MDNAIKPQTRLKCTVPLFSVGLEPTVNNAVGSRTRELEPTKTTRDNVLKTYKRMN